MTRILQIRRGTTAQNNNFTGLAGEITFDTDAKTLRIHDGEKLGGYALARADATGGGTTPVPGDAFDINTVSDEFWSGLFARMSPAPFTVLTSRPMPAQNNSYLEYIFDTPLPAKFVQIFLICQTPQAGYSIGDEVSAWGIDTRTNPAPNTFNDSDGLHVRLMIGSQNFWVSHKNTGATTNITNENWRIKFHVYC